MSLFGYPATVIHQQAVLDDWNRVTGYTPENKKAKVIEEQKIVKNANGEDVQSIAEIHLEGPQQIDTKDYFNYVNALGETVAYYIKHIEVKKQLGTDDIKKVIVYG
ncbi:hypothetical protein HF072_07435 [Bacillus sp. RO3]|nr:hypothetical protein [Bacillus sp. RO3]